MSYFAIFCHVMQLSTSQKNCNCAASISIRIKKNTVQVRKRDGYVKRGLCGIIEIDNRHGHLLKNAEALHWLRLGQANLIRQPKNLLGGILQLVGHSAGGRMQWHFVSEADGCRGQPLSGFP
jgi:hypothetical protein